ncbi:MAG: hypothetical protein R8F63_18435 [Acidimicrobiales bacterium]|nr:hypothetical protein [Acidimicrobiales bacterium]
MTRAKSLAVGFAVLIGVVVATSALALNAGFVAAGTGAEAVAEPPAPTTTTYEQYLEEWYAANPTTTAPPATTTTPVEPVIIYEYVDVPVTVPPPQIVYVPAPTVTNPPASTSGPPSTTVPSSSDTTTTRPPTTTAAPMELLEFDLYGFAEVTIASHGPGDRLQAWEIEQDSPWVWEVEDDNGPKVEVKFFNTETGKEAKLSLRLDDDGYKLKTEGDGFAEREEYL